MVARALAASLLVLAAACDETDPLYCKMHPDDRANCAHAGGQDCHAIAPLGLSACTPAAPPAPITITETTTFDTTASTSMPAGLACAQLDSGSSDVCVLAGTSIAIAAGATLSVTGQRPLVLASDSTIDIAGTLDVASHSNGRIGPDADAAGCMPGSDAPLGGGGAGGSFGGAGGAGGNEANPVGSSSSAGAAITGTTLRGGCPGTHGHGSSDPAGGHGGGAVALVATSISITGSINASGAGGSASGDAGGGGGGAGGMIVLAAPTITATSAGIFANGGGGGGGAGGTSGGPGGDPSDPTMGGGPGAPGSGAGPGGAGYPGAILDGASGTVDPAAGGGGGGGAGLILTVGSAPVSGPNVSPPSR